MKWVNKNHGNPNDQRNKKIALLLGGWIQSDVEIMLIDLAIHDYFVRKS